MRNLSSITTILLGVFVEFFVQRKPQNTIAETTTKYFCQICKLQDVQLMAKLG